MQHLIFSTLCMCLVATQSVALSCIRPDIARTFNNAADLPYDITILIGRIVAEEDAFNGAGAAGLARHSAFHKGTFAGYQIGPNGRSADLTTAITVEKGCIASWCGDVPSDPETIFFTSSAQGIGEDGLLATFGACGGDAFPATAANMETLQSCLSGGPCTLAN